MLSYYFKKYNIRSSFGCLSTSCRFFSNFLVLSKDLSFLRFSFLSLNFKQSSSFLFITLIFFQILDAIFTYQGVYRFGIEMEANPLIRYLMNIFGAFFAICLVKSLAVFCVLSIWSLSEKIKWIKSASKYLCLYYFFFAILPWTYLLSV